MDGSYRRHMTYSQRKMRILRPRRLLLASAAAFLVAVAGPASAALACPEPGGWDLVPAVGSGLVTCDVGVFTPTAGILASREVVRTDRAQRAHVRFDIHMRDVVLVDEQGRHYRLVGSGSDAVLYADEDLTGHIIRERVRYHFDVVGRQGVVGVMRFHLNTNRDGTTTVTDESTCQLPNQ